jgi:hypothetical protein
MQLTRESRERQQKAANEEKIIKWTVSLAIGTWILALTTFIVSVFTGINLLILKGQGRDLRQQRQVMQTQAAHMEEQAVQLKAAVATMQSASERQAGEVRESLRIGQETVGTMQRNAERQLRAYITIKKCRVLCEQRPAGLWLEWHPEIINTGQTPAYDLRCAAKAGIKPSTLPPGTDLMQEIERTGEGSQYVLGPGQMIWNAPHLNRHMSAGDLKNLKSPWPTSAFYVWGIVTYKDIFGKEHWTTFCSVADWDPSGNPLSRCAPQHNEADAD